MALLKVRTYPDPILKQKAQEVAAFGKDMQKLFDDMIETMHIEDGVGLAAPQIGISKQIFIACPTSEQGKEYVMVNPKIESFSGMAMDTEGCLSLPGIFGEIPRYTKVRLSYVDRNGKPHSEELTDFFARVIQHEMDHLNGLLLIDRVDFNKRQELLAQYNKL